MSKMKQVLILDPPSELHFKPPFTKVTTSYINLTNPTDRDVSFRVRTTQPKKYVVEPIRGTIQPKNTVSVEIRMQPVDIENLDKSRHKFMIQSIFSPEEEFNFDDLWNNTPADNFMISKLRCVFDIPPEPPQAESLTAIVHRLEMERSQLMKQLEEEKAIRKNLEELLKKKDIQLHEGFDRLSLNFQDALLDEEDSDVTFRVGDQNYPAHKVIIKAMSPVLRAMLKCDKKEKSEVINVPDCDSLVFHDFLSFLYTGKLDAISNKNVCELYHLSDKYDVKSLKMICIDFMGNNLSVDTICDVISLAARHSEETLLSRAADFFTDHAQDILVTAGWQKFVSEHPTAVNELFLKTCNKISKK